MPRRGLLAAVPVAALAATFLLLTGGCSKSNDNNNTPPVLDLVTANPETIQVKGTSTLLADAHDPDGDGLTFHWEAAAGTLESDGRAAVWTAPDLDGTFSILCTVSDSHGGQDHALTNVYVLSRLLAAYETVRSFQGAAVTYDHWQGQGFSLPRDALIDSIGVRVDHLEGDPGSLVLELWSVGAEGPDQQLYTGLPQPGAVGWNLTFFPDGHFVQKDVLLAVVVKTNQTAPGGSYVLTADMEGQYADGTNMESTNGGTTWVEHPTVDLVFRVVGRWQ